MLNTDGKFFLGKDLSSEESVLYDPDDLTTHAVVLGMTGSGKTGLCIDLLEEAALNNIPALLIDPKGDMTNALLHFPDLLPSDFQPWINPDEARRDDKTLEEAAEGKAALWKKGLKGWGIGKERITALKNSAHFAIYTPGSDAGIPISILASLKAPELAWKGNEELLREKISGTVTAILGLVGMNDIDPVRSREHILLANIFEDAWSQGRDLDLAELIMRTQNPPFEKLGVFDLNTFFAEKDRFELAMLLNNILAAPTFQTWITGQPLDIPSLLFGPDGRPRHSVFYIAHLNDAERMFFVTLLYSAVETWMRAQSGSTSLRAIMYFDEIFGYLPPVSNPPSKPLMLRMLKQARAFGVGQVLVTQNPVDVDYKALSNAGTWMIGKLQTERDKERLLDGLEGAASGNLNRKEYDKLISKLGKREFLLHNVHEKKPQIFGTRWAMNYLAGPLTRTHIPALNEMVGAEITAGETKTTSQAEKKVVEPKKSKAASSNSEGSETRPAIPASIGEYFLPNNLNLGKAYKEAGLTPPEKTSSQSILYKPVLLAQANVRYLQRQYNLDHETKTTALVPTPDRRGVVRWEEFTNSEVDPKSIENYPVPNARFAVLEGALGNGKLLSSLEKDFVDFVYRNSEIKVMTSKELKIFAGPPTTQGEFRKTLSEAAKKSRDAEIKKLETKYKTKIQSVQKKLNREKRELTEDQEELSQRKMVELGTHAENLLGLFTGRGSSRKVSTSLSKRRMTSKAKSDVEESVDAIAELEKELLEISGEVELAVDEVEEKWEMIASEIEELPVTPYKKDILIDLYGVAWMPFHVIEVGKKVTELPGYKA
ncbi:MAG: DUF87 domain-containing protein [Chloroflexi bacterium]|jgi:hypothetical protein|nr:DUF87 domain-containing protein [Chloroflexota bacterium]MBT3671228.1 DUF87 domain-containing protein [Chloroflexota bacterium]MBT4003548.1 DUF87 domain-containing protein [Chloroflexota bacterium]MBT4304313.1 DUF87 domain-containing protein [Chloroflexota bacterium]MBT4534332.1 DUF87 domain-containing protein [Chloroflexota bacterium]